MSGEETDMSLRPGAASALAFATAVACSAAPQAARAAAAPEAADLVLRGGRIVTLDPARPEASALAARGGRIVALGSDAEIAPLVGAQTRVVTLGGRLAIPGFVEGHAHFAGIGEAFEGSRFGSVDKSSFASRTQHPRR
jgi:predicted amidohydrolase YtcJ